MERAQQITFPHASPTPNNFLSNPSIVSPAIPIITYFWNLITSSSPPVSPHGALSLDWLRVLGISVCRRWLYGTSWIIRVRMSSCSLLGQDCDIAWSFLTVSLQNFQIWRQKPPARVNWGHPRCRDDCQEQKNILPMQIREHLPWKRKGMKGKLSINSHQFKVYHVPVTNCCDILK